MTIPRTTIEEIKRKVDIIEIVGRYVRLEKRGNRWWGLSPFKTEKTPSFTVQPDQGFYYCFATQKGGDVISFVMEMERLPYPEAVRFLGEITGVRVDDGPPDPKETHRTALLELNSRVTRTFQYLLTSDKRGVTALEYLRRRGIPDEMITVFKLGYAPEDGKWLRSFLKSKSYSDEFLDRSGLFAKEHPDFAIFRNRLMFPIIDERDNIRAFGGRSLDQEARAKYLNSPETDVYHKKYTLFGLSQAVKKARETNTVVLCEGYMDVLALHLAGVSNVVAPLGTAFTEEQAKILKRWVERVVILFDEDEAGRNATFKAAMVVEKTGLNSAAVLLPRGEDPADVLSTRGTEYLWNSVENPAAMIDYLIDVSIDSEKDSGVQARELVLRKLFPYITITSSEVRRESYLDRVSERLEVSPASVRTDYKRWQEGDPQDTGSPRIEKIRNISTDMHLMLAVIEHGELFAYLRNQITSDDLEDPSARKVFLAMEDVYRRGEMEVTKIIDKIDDDELRQTVFGKISSGEYEKMNRVGIDQSVMGIRVRQLTERQRELERQLRNVGGEESVTLLLQEKMVVDEELSTLKARSHDGTAE